MALFVNNCSISSVKRHSLLAKLSRFAGARALATVLALSKKTPDVAKTGTERRPLS